MYRTPIPWSPTYNDSTKSATGSSAHMRPMESQLQQKDAAFSGECLAHEAMGSSAYMKQMRLQLQQKNAMLSVGIRQHEEFEQKPKTWEEKWEKETSQWGKGASNGIHETHEEFVCKFREKLQEFAMILNKKYHYNFPAEYFDDYRGSFNPDEFLKMEQPKEELRWWKDDSTSSFQCSVNGLCKSYDSGDAAVRLNSKTSSLVVENSEDLRPSLKGIKAEQPGQHLIPQSETSAFSVPTSGESHKLLIAHCQEYQHGDTTVSMKAEAIEVKMEILSSSGQERPHVVELKEDDKDETAETATVAKSGKPKIKGVSLTEVFTPEQVREHIKSLKQRIGQSKAKAEKNQAMEHLMSENSCELCAVEKLSFEPPPIYCTPCGARIKRNAMYYTVGAGDTRQCFCIPFYNEVCGDTVLVDGTAIPKAKLDKKKNDGETEEWWVQCDKCEAWQHQICALFNGRRNDGGQAEYTCPNCYIAEIERRMKRIDKVGIG